MFVMRKILLKQLICLMQNPKMFDLLKGQFVSNLNQDLLALSGFVNEDELCDIVDKAMEMVRSKAEKDNE